MMGGLSIWHLLLLGAAALLVFGGRGKVSDLMGDFGKGLKSFRAGLNTPDEPQAIGTEETKEPLTS
jgi:sec-independent protein translocase protein TatA